MPEIHCSVCWTGEAESLEGAGRSRNAKGHTRKRRVTELKGRPEGWKQQLIRGIRAVGRYRRDMSSQGSLDWQC